MKKIFIRVSIIIMFVIGIMCINQRVYASNENYNLFKEKVNSSNIHKLNAKNNTNITNELENLLKITKGSSEYIMIYVPSGTYYINYANNLVLNSNLYLVLENDTNIIKQDSSDSIIRTRKEENINGCTIYGGTWYGQNKAKRAIEINNAKNILIQNVNIKECKENGIYVNNSSQASIKNSTITKNYKSGLAIYGESNLDINNSIISYNSEYGICIADSVLNCNGSDVIYNNYSGISATKNTTKVFASKNKISYNGQKPKNSSSGAIGHGIGISEKASAIISENFIESNKECGISVFDGGDVRVAGNVIEYNKRHGVGARKNAKLDLSTNDICQNSYNGILLSDGSNLKLYRDNISNNNNFGLSVVDYSKANIDVSNIKKNKSANISVSVGNDKRNNSKVTLLNNNDISESKSNHGIVLSGKTNLEIKGKNNNINKNAKCGISANKNSKVKVTGKTTISRNKQSGISINGGKAEISNVALTSNSKYGITVMGKGDLNIKKSTITKNKNYGINVDQKSTKAKIENNKIEKNARAGIMIKSKAKVTSIYKNTLNKNGQIGISIKSSTVNSIKKNTIKNHTKYGIYIEKSKKPKITKNKMSNKKAKKEVYTKK